MVSQSLVTGGALQSPLVFSRRFIIYIELVSLQKKINQLKVDTYYEKLECIPKNDGKTHKR